MSADTKEGSQYSGDVEKAPAPHHMNSDLHGKTTVMELEALDDGVPRNKGIFAKLWKLAARFDAFGAETRGIERVMPDERPIPPQKPIDAFTMWMAANMTISTFSLGTLGPSIFELGLKDSALVIIFFNLLSTLPVAWFSTFGARTGLRQMVFSRYSFGYYVAMFPGVLNVIATVGWSTINTIVGAQTLKAVSTTHQLPIAAGVVVIAILTLVPSFLGYRIVHMYERWAAIIPAIIFLIMLGEGAPHMVSGPYGGTGSIEAADILSFGAAIVGFGIGWVSYAADYTVNMPENTSSGAIFWATYVGLNVPLILIETLGAAYITTLDNKPTWAAAYDANGVGGLIAAGLSPLGGFGHFLTCLMALSIVANNIPNVYSMSLTVQIFGPVFQAIPRLFITLLGTVAYIILAIVGASHFDSWLDTLLVILSYWLCIFFAIVAEEHLIFRRNSFSNYPLNGINDPSVLPPGFAAMLAMGCGIAGAVLGMAQTWYVGVIGKKIGLPEYGGDIGFELSFSFAAIVYPIARYFEKRAFGR